MTQSEGASAFWQEVQEVIGALCSVDECVDGRWMAYLDTTHEFVREGLQPPGQINIWNESGYTACSEVWADDGPLMDLTTKTARVEYNEKWAARPFFHSFKTARGKIEEWVRENRPDIKRAAEQQVREAFAYRRRHPEP